TRAGTDVYFGLGDYNDLVVRYRRVMDIGPPGPELAAAITRIATQRGERGSGGEDVNYTALHQIATGTGVGPVHRGSTVAPNQQANFRPGSLRVVVDIANESIQNDPDGATRDVAVAALFAKGIAHIG